MAKIASQLLQENEASRSDKAKLRSTRIEKWKKGGFSLSKKRPKIFSPSPCLLSSFLCHCGVAVLTQSINAWTERPISHIDKEASQNRSAVLEVGCGKCSMIAAIAASSRWKVRNGCLFVANWRRCLAGWVNVVGWNSKRECEIPGARWTLINLFEVGHILGGMELQMVETWHHPARWCHPFYQWCQNGEEIGIS